MNGRRTQTRKRGFRKRACVEFTGTYSFELFPGFQGEGRGSSCICRLPVLRSLKQQSSMSRLVRSSRCSAVPHDVGSIRLAIRRTASLWALRSVHHCPISPAMSAWMRRSVHGSLTSHGPRPAAAICSSLPGPDCDIRRSTNHGQQRPDGFAPISLRPAQTLGAVGVGGVEYGFVPTAGNDAGSNLNAAGPGDCRHLVEVIGEDQAALELVPGDCHRRITPRRSSSALRTPGDQLRVHLPTRLGIRIADDAPGIDLDRSGPRFRCTVRMASIQPGYSGCVRHADCRGGIVPPPWCSSARRLQIGEQRLTPGGGVPANPGPLTPAFEFTDRIALITHCAPSAVGRVMWWLLITVPGTAVPAYPIDLQAGHPRAHSSLGSAASRCSTTLRGTRTRRLIFRLGSWPRLNHRLTVASEMRPTRQTSALVRDSYSGAGWSPTVQ